MSDIIDKKHGLDDMGEEEKVMDPVVMSGFIIPLLFVIGIPLVLIGVKFFFR